MKAQSRKEDLKPQLTFDMLQTDDSTDDEDATKKRADRPQPPAWSWRKFLILFKILD